MKVIVFTGPTLSAQEGARALDATFLPPAAQGDVYRAALDAPVVIAIIDGYFEQVPSVAHKEVLWAMSQGVHVFGAASMGALRAAELAAFGMVGVGEVFEAYARGELTDDDEVAVAHALAEDGYRATSEPMVNVRATLRRGAEERWISEATCDALTQIAKAMFYADRCWPAIVAAARDKGIADEELTRLRRALPEGRVDVKKRDALAMLAEVRSRLASGTMTRKEVRYSFQSTDAWASIARHTVASQGCSSRGLPGGR